MKLKTTLTVLIASLVLFTHSLSAAELKKNEWMCFDIQPVEPKANATFDGDGVFVPITSRDTIADMPEGYVVGITNPP